MLPGDRSTTRSDAHAHMRGLRRSFRRRAAFVSVDAPPWEENQFAGHDAIANDTHPARLRGSSRRLPSALQAAKGGQEARIGVGIGRHVELHLHSLHGCACLGSDNAVSAADIIAKFL